LLALAVGSWTASSAIVRRREAHEEAMGKSSLLESALQKYIPRTAYDRLLTDPARTGLLGGESQDLVVLFADIRGFTRFAEKQDPQYVVSVLNRILTALTTPLRVMDGILDKYIGDGLLAFFEPANSLADAVERATTAGRMMHRAFQNLHEDVPSEELRALGLGIGICAGRVVVGNVGSEASMDYTVVGDAVNVAARLQAMAKPGEIIISESTYVLLKNPSRAEKVDVLKLRGRDQALGVYRILTDA
jgi:class 3 adenylate cyclase